MQHCGKCKIIINSNYNVFAFDDWKFCLVCEIFVPYERKTMNHKYIPFCESCRQTFKPIWMLSDWTFRGLSYIHRLKLTLQIDDIMLPFSIFCNECAANDFHTIRIHLYNSRTQSRRIHYELNELWEMETINYDNYAQWIPKETLFDVIPLLQREMQHYQEKSLYLF